MTWLLACAAAIVPQAAAPAAPLPVPNRSPKLALARVFRCLNEVCERRTAEDRMIRQFDTALDHLADCVDDAELERCVAREGTDLAAKLVVIARDRRRYPDRYCELDRYTRQKPDPRMAAPWPDPVRPFPAHAVESYRLAWEHLLLRPTPGQWPALQSRAAVTALNMIGSDASLPGLVFVFQTAWSQSETNLTAIGPRLNQLLDTFGRRPSSRRLRVLLDLAVWIEGRHRNSLLPANWMEPLYCMNETLHGPHKEEWAGVLRSFRWHGLPPAQRRLLEAALRKDKIPPE